MRDVVFSAVRPLILGDGKQARITAWQFFAAYGVRSTVMDKKRRLGSFFCPFYTFRRLPPTSSDDFILMSLDRFADEEPELTVILITAEDGYGEFVKRNLQRLESRFIVRSHENACRIRPFKRQNIKD